MKHQLATKARRAEEPCEVQETPADNHVTGVWKFMQTQQPGHPKLPLLSGVVAQANSSSTLGGWGRKMGSLSPVWATSRVKQTVFKTKTNRKILFFKGAGTVAQYQSPVLKEKQSPPSVSSWCPSPRSFQLHSTRRWGSKRRRRAVFSVKPAWKRFTETENEANSSHSSLSFVFLK